MSKVVDAKHDSETQKITLVKKVRDTVTLKTPENKTIAVDPKGGKVIAEDSASVVAVLEVLGREKGFDGVCADFKIPTSTIAGDVEFVTELRERGFTVDGDGYWGGRAYGREIEEIVMRLPSDNLGLTSQGRNGFTVAFTEIRPETLLRIPEVILSESFNHRRHDIVFVQIVVEPMWRIWRGGDALMYRGPEVPPRDFGYIHTPQGRILLSPENNAIMMGGEIASETWRKLSQYSEEMRPKITLILPEEAAGDFEQKYGPVQFLSFSNGWRAYSMPLEVMDGLKRDAQFPGGIFSFGFDNPREYRQILNEFGSNADMALER
ncbi:MAG: hypothetical protein B7Y25_00950 [Alphaproteobacteria bacterium 16-39-46]|nr:MAG: hypothetical protein B7Y25_00950 [Alphaproteobacteria bacterium 16-39-46]OZA44192.1 MAG: hypothetical protein B7X84_01030 [Alphaproteobacteria bacterium 17-39-52]HQS83680.1 hypothetical protein [Alphaproteobacteria bacterium]HQS93424.1 hypothetical protein [Alphaproteobacteria bacterium]